MVNDGDGGMRAVCAWSRWRERGGAGRGAEIAPALSPIATTCSAKRSPGDPASSIIDNTEPLNGEDVLISPTVPKEIAPVLACSPCPAMCDAMKWG